MLKRHSPSTVRFIELCGLDVSLLVAKCLRQCFFGLLDFADIMHCIAFHVVLGPEAVAAIIAVALRERVAQLTRDTDGTTDGMRGVCSAIGSCYSPLSPAAMSLLMQPIPAEFEIAAHCDEVIAWAQDANKWGEWTM